MAHSNSSTTNQNHNRQMGADSDGHQPVWLVPLFDSIPVELKQSRQFLAWKAQKRDSKWTKVPFNARNGNSGSSTNPATWSSFDDAKAAFIRGGYTGIGVAMADQLAGVDLDDCVDPETGQIAEWALLIIREFDSYTEISPSGKGVRILFKGKLPGKGLNRKVNGCHIEMYDQGRFLTLTGHHVKGTPKTIEPRQEVANSRYQWVLINTGGSKQSAGQPAIQSTAQPSFDPNRKDSDLTDSEVEEDKKLLARLLKNGALQQIWQGDITGFRSRSEADWRLLCTLVEMTADDAQVLRLWRASGLNRPKLYRGNRWPEDQVKKARTSLSEPLEMPVFEESPETDRPADDYDPLISSDPKREMFLRYVLNRGALMSRARMFLAAQLGFRKVPWRLLQAIHSFSNGGKLIEISVSDKLLATRYSESKTGGMSLDAIRRDRSKLKKDQARVGVELVHITGGSMDYSTGKGFSTRYENKLDRWALETIDSVMEFSNNRWYVSPRELQKAAREKAARILEAAGRSPYRPQPSKKREKKNFETVAAGLSDLFKRKIKEIAKLALDERIPPGKLERVFKEAVEDLTKKTKKTSETYFKDFPIDVTVVLDDDDDAPAADCATVKRGQRKTPQAAPETGPKKENHRYANLHTDKLDYSGSQHEQNQDVTGNCAENPKNRTDSLESTTCEKTCTFENGTRKASSADLQPVNDPDYTGPAIYREAGGYEQDVPVMIVSPPWPIDGGGFAYTIDRSGFQIAPEDLAEWEDNWEPDRIRPAPMEYFFYRPGAAQTFRDFRTEDDEIDDFTAEIIREGRSSYQDESQEAPL